jgi:hypothetical protein
MNREKCGHKSTLPDISGHLAKYEKQQQRIDQMKKQAHKMMAAGMHVKQRYVHHV